MLLSALLVASTAAHAADPLPEITRAVASPQAVGVVHTLRTIPEACARLEGQFSRDAAVPYKLAAVRTSERCAPRAKLVDAKTAKASMANGWLLNDVIRVPEAGCPARQAVVRVWRKDIKPVPPKLDAQGRSRIYLKDSMDAARAGDLKPIPVFATSMVLEGLACK
ncbi:MAG: hypothetical protein EOO27_43220 [Comamonadaceae bacterium]|nr:MAG: hypothetical protein EOO27_43220 [Comamonadaceae bacterium]